MRIFLPPCWSLMPLDGVRRLQIVADDDSARIYLVSTDKAEMGAHDDSLAAWAEARMAQVPHVLATLPPRPLTVAGKSALQLSVLREVRPGGPPFGYCVTFIDDGDRFDDVILDSYRLERAAPVLADVLASLEYRGRPARRWTGPTAP